MTDEEIRETIRQMLADWDRHHAPDDGKCRRCGGKGCEACDARRLAR